MLTSKWKINQNPKFDGLQQMQQQLQQKLNSVLGLETDQAAPTQLFSGAAAEDILGV